MNMKKVVLATFAVFALIGGNAIQKQQKGKKITVACYYFPNYHTGDPHNVSDKGKNWSEWELVRQARPRFEGHQQPKVPAWGYSDEKDPAVMSQKIKAAADNSIDVFIFDWYWYDGKPFLNRALDEGFLGAPNRDRLKFGLMWANHHWTELFPFTRGEAHPVIYPGTVTPEMYDQVCDHLVADYFTQPGYWLINGKAYFSIYDIARFIESFGSIQATREAMDRLDAKARSAGLEGVHWNIIAIGNPILPEADSPKNLGELIARLPFDSATSYVWIHHVGMGEREVDYNAARDGYFAHWNRAENEYGVPYYPNVTMGWDSSPRTNQNREWAPNWGYPFSGVMVNNTPKNFREALQMTKDKLLADPDGPHIMNINCWNEWTEGSYLEPDTVHGTAYLDAVREVFKD